MILSGRVAAKIMKPEGTKMEEGEYKVEEEEEKKEGGKR